MIVCQKGGNISKEYKLPPKKTIGVINNVGIIDICSKLELINPIRKPNNAKVKATKTLIIGAVILATSTFFVEVTILHPMLMVFLLVLVAFTFALFGFLIGLMSSNFEQMSIIPTLVITPMVFLGGSLYSLDMLPPFWQMVTYFNPVVYLINGLRFAFYGASDFNIWISIASMIFFLVLCISVVAYVLKKGYTIKS